MNKENQLDNLKQILNNLQNIEIERDIIEKNDIIDMNNIKNIQEANKYLNQKINNIKINFNEYFDILNELNNENNDLYSTVQSMSQKGGAKKKKKSNKKKSAKKKSTKKKSTKKKSAKKKSTKKKSTKKKSTKKKSTKKKSSTKKKTSAKKKTSNKKKPASIKKNNVKKIFTNQSSESFPSSVQQSDQSTQKQQKQDKQKQDKQKKQDKQTLQGIQIPEITPTEQDMEVVESQNEMPNYESPTIENKQFEQMSDDEFNFQQEQEGAGKLLNSGHKITNLLENITKDLLM
jgi:hypothetical protein